jgi:hypothetical protein
MVVCGKKKKDRIAGRKGLGISESGWVGMRMR